MTRDIILAIDNGTQSVRALLFDLRGNLLAKSRVLSTPQSAPEPGWAEQDPEIYWAELCQACQQLWQQTDIAREAIAGVALTTQRSTVVSVDQAGVPLRPAISWMDQRRTHGLKPVGGMWGLAFAASGMTETAAYLQAEAECNWIRTHQPDVWQRTHKYLFLSGYLTYRLTGRFADSVGCQVGYVPFDYKRLRWAGRNDWKWQAVPMSAGRPARSDAALGPAGRDHRGGCGGDRDSRRPPADRRRGGQSLRGDRRRLPGTAHRLPQLRHDGDHQHYEPQIRRGHPADPALPGRRARRLQRGGPDLPRLLDGELVQAGVRLS